MLADTLGVKYMKLAGYKPHAMIDFLQKLHEINQRKPARPKSYFRTHPFTADRVRAVKQELGENLTFTDVMNTQPLPYE